ncbi:MAG: hypothetical protein AUG47_08395 [Alphaproteobacteria bacterium 13_1_20CM_3_64_12]|nr:MAG: hypothetical protein AUG47_08395 [Alphaproteobacteria bacterium 13_1_20CM_3_64_12]
MRLRRRFECPGRKDDREIDPEPRPVDMPQIGDRRGDLAAEQVDAQRQLPATMCDPAGGSAA